MASGGRLFPKRGDSPRAPAQTIPPEEGWRAVEAAEARRDDDSEASPEPAVALHDVPESGSEEAAEDADAGGPPLEAPEGQAAEAERDSTAQAHQDSGAEAQRDAGEETLEDRPAGPQQEHASRAASRATPGAGASPSAGPDTAFAEAQGPATAEPTPSGNAGSAWRDVPTSAIAGWKEVADAADWRPVAQADGAGAPATAQAAPWQGDQGIPSAGGEQGDTIRFSDGHLTVSDSWVVAGNQRWPRGQVYSAAIEHRRGGRLGGFIGFIVLVVLAVIVEEAFDLPRVGSRPFLALPAMGALFVAVFGIRMQELILHTASGRAVAAKADGKSMPQAWGPFIQALQQR